MVVGIVVALLGLAGIVLGSVQLRGALPSALRTGPFSAYVNILTGVFLLVLAVLRLKGAL